MQPDEQAATAEAIEAAWIDLAIEGEDYVRVLVGETVIDHGASENVPVAMDGLVDRLVVDRTLHVVRCLWDFMRIGEGPDRLRYLLGDRFGKVSPVQRLASIFTTPDAQGAFIEVVDPENQGAAVLTDRRDEFVQRLASFVWERVRPGLGSRHPAVPIELCRPLAKILSGRCLTPDAGDGRWNVAHRGRLLGEMRDAPILAPTRENMFPGKRGQKLAPQEFERDLGSVASHRLIRELLFRGWERLLLDRTSEPGRVRLDGGWQALTSPMGLHGGATTQNIRLAGRALSLLSVRHSGSPPERILHLHEGTSASKTYVEFELVNALHPGYVLRKSKHSNRFLVPLPHFLPPLHSSKLAARALCHRARCVAAGRAG
ncbi:MAG: hypothetical protein K8H88_19920 [Sandaracinaceae bacterium]|nr:hypothetical protein [Sandaracinaceae bacterium]